eukprot:6583177-Pyramimonas_sp.AAC.1
MGVVSAPLASLPPLHGDPGCFLRVSRGRFRGVQWGRASRNRRLIARVSWVSSLLGLRGGFPQPVKELLRS